jgi:exopolysaccharide/PEP-CTERM locus tyrosine autokinase
MGRMFDALKKAEREKNQEFKDDFPKTTQEDIVLDSKMVSFFEPSSMAAEQFRKLRSYIIKPGMGNTTKTILITSAMAGEGKSLIAINFAISIASELHSHALLVDCDLRNPTLSRWFGFDEANGLSNYLTGQAELPDILVKTPVDKLSIIPGGALRENPAELIGSNKMKSLVADLKTRYADRYIILDSSPLLATTEPSVINEMVDGIIIVIKAGVTPRESVQQAIKLLDKKKIIGVVLNDLEFKTEALIRRYFGSDRYYYNYQYDKLQSAPGNRGKFSSIANDIKMLFSKKQSKK